MSKNIPREEYLLWLPKKRMAAGVIISDEEGRVLILKTSYKETWEIPWGVTEKWESLKICAKRETFEEIWVDITVWDLLVLEYCQTDIDDSLMFIFDWWVINKRDIVVDNAEIIETLFVWEDELQKYITHKWLLKRVQNALEKDSWVYYEALMQ